MTMFYVFLRVCQFLIDSGPLIDTEYQQSNKSGLHIPATIMKYGISSEQLPGVWPL